MGRKKGRQGGDEGFSRGQERGNLEAYPTVSKDPIRIYLQEIRRTRLLRAEEELELAERISRGDDDARRIMIESNLRLVGYIGRR